MGGGALHQPNRRVVAAARVIDDQRGERAKIGGRCARRPAHDAVRVAIEIVGQTVQQPGPSRPAVMRLEHDAQRLAAEPGAAALVGERQTPAADAVLAAGDDGPADAAGSGDDDAAIGPLMRADARGIGIGDKERAAKRQHLPPRFLLGGGGSRGTIVRGSPSD